MIFMSFALTLVQISSGYLRYLPFSRELPKETAYRLRNYFLMWSLVGLAINFWIFSGEVSYRTFKTALAVGWIPYGLISMWIIQQRIPQHIFVFGMQGIWSFTLHALAGMSVALIYGQMSEEFLPLQISLYLIFFVVLLKIELKIFTNLLPTARFFENTSLRWTIALLPMVIFIGTIISIPDVTFFPSWKERFSRISLPIVFFLIYRSLSFTTRQFEEKQLQEEKNRVLRRQMESLSEHNALIKKNYLEVSRLGKNLAGDYLEIEKMLIEGKKSEAMEFIRQQTHLLESTRIKTFCLLPLINAALSIYSRRAERLGIKIEHRIDLPEQISANESDLAVLVSNLLENAIEAVKKNTSKREISIIIRNMGGRNILEITNRCDLPIKIGENGLPYTTKIGHGLGMSSLELFVKKYDAFVDFSQENGIVRVNLYWNDYL